MIVSDRICAHCGNAYEPMPGNRGHEQRYCSPQCRRKEGKRREAQRISKVGGVGTIEPRTMSPKDPNNEPIMSQDNEWVYDLIDKVCEANMKAHKWQIRYNTLLDRVERFVARIEEKIDDI